MAKGTISWFNNEQGIGFIEPDDGGQQVFVLRRLSCPDDLGAFEVGEMLEFDVEMGALSPYATNIRRVQNHTERDWEKTSLRALSSEP